MSLPRRAGLWFAVRFGCMSVVLLGIYYFPYPEQSEMRTRLDGFLHLYASSVGFVLRWFEPDVRVVGQEIFGRYSLRIVKTCDAMDVTILLASALLAWPFAWRRKALAAAASVLLFYVVNVLRISSLYWIGVFFPSFFERAHVDLWPVLILVIALAFFVAAITWSRTPSEGRAHDAA